MMKATDNRTDPPPDNSGIYKTNRVSASSKDPEAFREALDTIAAQCGPVPEIRGFVSACAEFLSDRGLPSRQEAITVFGDGKWKYGKSRAVRSPASLHGTVDGALQRLGFARNTVEWHAAKVVTRGTLALRAVERGDAQSALDAAMHAVEAWGRFQIQSTGVEADAMTGQRTSDRNRSNARSPRRSKDVDGIFSRLAKADGTPKELWPRFIALLDDNSMEPTEDVTGAGNLQVCYSVEEGRRKTITFPRFRDALRELRKKR